MQYYCNGCRLVQADTVIVCEEYLRGQHTACKAHIIHTKKAVAILM
jgi:hypothetical protein